MAKIVPFRGVRYNPGRVPDPARVMAPPYDVISPSLQDELSLRHENNIVKLILGKTQSGDSEQDNRYTRSARFFQQWQDEEILVRDQEPSIYLYDQEYSIEDGQILVRHGVVALSRIEDFSTGLVKPHEKTLSDPKADRYQLTRACNANLSPVFALYSDPCCVLEVFCKREKNRDPDLAVRDDDGVTHRLWRTAEPSLISKVQSVLDNKPLLIADGHHRYEAAISYRNYMREKHPAYTGKELFNYVMICFSNMEDRGMQVFPAHRVVSNLPQFRLEAFFGELVDYFDIDSRPLDAASASARLEVRQTLAELGKSRHVLALFTGTDQIHYLSLKDEKVMDQFFDTKTPKVLRTLDVSILHRLVLGRLLKISHESLEKQSNLQYIKGFDEPFRLVAEEGAPLAFLMNPTRMSEVREVANSEEKMPQKSTYFYPKLLSGMVVNKIVEGESVGS
ncbi:DUF1015 domain-containing protein [Trichloromonas sp.]|uniref:DUF1015 domain-containing protein n=1 Tax=Trichloromonas sp. TaxID=3069249 RepID=UPI003D814CD2